MNLSEYIKQLKALEDKYGDLPVKTHGLNCINDASAPQARNMRILVGKERKPQLLQSWDNKSLAGEPVILV